MSAPNHQRKIRLVVWVLLIAGVLIQPTVSRAQVMTAITPTLGAGNLNTQVNQVGNSYDITGGTLRGSNLFHSLRLFSVGGGDIANFSNTMGPGITNILSRVTGMVRSDIYGTIQTTNFPGANLFLFNPYGVAFGPGASLNISGSFHVSTADYVLLSDGVRFNATPGPADALLTTAPPAAFGFLGPTAAPISIQGSFLQVPEGQTLSVVGGNIQILADPSTGATATLMAPSGRVQIASVALPGEVGLVGPGGVPALDVTSFSTLGQIDISGGSVIDASDVSNITGAGTVVIRGGHLALDSSQISSNTMDVDGAPVGIDIQLGKESVLPDGTPVGGTLTLMNGASLGTTTSGLGRGGDVQVTASDIQIDASSVSTSTFGDGSGGNLLLTANPLFLPDGTSSGGTLTLTNFASVGTSTFFGAGGSGDINLSAGDLRIDGSTVSSSTVFGTGTAGNVTITADRIALANGGSILSENQGFTPASGGNVTVNVAESIGMSGQAGILSTSFFDGDGGDLAVSAQSLTMDGGASISSAAFGDGQGGSIGIKVDRLSISDGASVSSNGGFTAPGGAITIAATESTLISGVDSLGNTSGIFGSSGGAPVGSISLTTGTLNLRDGARIQSGSVLAVSGDIKVQASGEVLISNGGGILSQTFDQPVGQLSLSAQALTLDNGFISTSTQGPGNAGNIEIKDVSTVALLNGGRILSSSEVLAQGDGGSVNLAASGSVTISGSSSAGNSGIFSTAAATGNAGEIVVTTPALFMGDGGTISVATSGAGNAGNIGLNVSNFTLTNAARVDSGTTGSGKGGTVTVNATGSGTISSGAGLFSNAEGTGAGGDLNIQAAQLYLLNGATISAESTGTHTALAGNVNIVAGSLLRMVNGTITTQSTVADGGNINIQTTGSTLRLTNSQITTSVQSSVGQGGNITIGSTGHPFDFILLDRSQIRADAFGGPGGNINMFANVYLTSASVVSASSALSTPGTIAIEATVTDVSGSLTQLPTTPLEAAALMRASCAARLAGGKASSLVLAGREGLPLDPSGLLPSPIVVDAPVAALAPDEELPWARNLLWVSYLSLDPNCLQ